jgi:hypothetical protein
VATASPTTWTATGLTLLLGFASLAVDSGFGLNERRETQNAADIAALAVWEDCNPQTSGTPNATQAARNAALENGYSHALADVEVAMSDVSSSPTADLRRWEVEITATNDTFFGEAGSTGAGEMTVVSRAVAECERIPLLGGYAIFAGADPTCGGGVELDLSGAGKIANGSVHSEGDFKVTGANTTITGVDTYRGNANLPGGLDTEKVYGSAFAHPIEGGQLRVPSGRRPPRIGADRQPLLRRRQLQHLRELAPRQRVRRQERIRHRAAALGDRLTEGDIDLSGLVAVTDTTTGQTVL